MNNKNKFKAIIALAVALAFLLPGSAVVANVGTIGITTNIENTDDIKTSYNTEITLDSITVNIIYVDDDNTEGPWDGTPENPYQYIQDGVDNALAGDTVYVYNGTYEHVFVDKSLLDLVGESRENVIVDGGISIMAGFEEYIEHVSIDSFSTTNGGYGIYSYKFSSNITITNCDAYGNTYHGIDLFCSSYSNIINCNAYNNGDDGIYINRASNCNIINCNAYGNTGNGIIYWNNLHHISPSECSITGCNAYNNGENGIHLTDCSNVIVSNCDVSYNGQDGIYVFKKDYSSSYNTITGCNAYSNIMNGIHIDKTDDSEISYCNVYDNTLDGIYLGYTYARRNIITNCEAYNNDGAGIRLRGQGVEYNIIANCNVHNNNVFETDLFLIIGGIYLQGASYNEITSCTVSANEGIGIFLSGCTGCTLTDNNINNDDFLVFGLAIADYLHNIGTSNTINGEPIFYLIQQDGVELNEAQNFGFLALIGCTNMIVTNSDVYGMLLFYTSGSTISNVDCHGSFAGPLILASAYNNFIDCDIYNSVYGLTFLASVSNTVTNCNVHDNMLYGITIGMGSTGIGVSNCNVYNNYAGIAVETSTTSEISSCNVYNNYAGVYIMGSSGNLIYNNYFADNTLNAFDDVSAGTNTWNIAKTAGTNIIGGSFLGGNFWSNYAGEDLDGDGLGDTLLPYNCNGFIVNGGDYLPLVADEYPPVITGVALTNSTPPDINFGWENITCTVTDACLGVDIVKLVVTDPDEIITEYQMTNIPETDTYYYNTTFTIVGDYTYQIWANDTANNIAITTPETFTLYPDWDIDMNGMILLDDFIRVATHYGEEGSPGWIREDVDNNGWILLADFIIIAGHYGEGT